MSTTVIPEDIQKQAARIAHRKDVLGLSFEIRERLADEIANAIVAERERYGRLETQLINLKAATLSVLEPFSNFAQLAEGFVQARAEQGGSPILPTRHFRVADFKAARDLRDVIGA